MRGLARTQLARSIDDASRISLFEFLRYTAAWYGRDNIAMDRFS